MQAATTQQSCSSRTTRVEAWIDGRIFDCSWDKTGLGNCFDEEQEHNAVVQAFDDGCGTWQGHSSHSYWDGSGSSQSLGSDGASLDGGTCQNEEADCEAAGGIMFEGVCTFASPIVIATGQNSTYKLVSAEDGVLFDIDGDGAAERVSWTDPKSEVAFLALDRNGDGQITSGKELFGNFTLPGSPNGFDALQKMAMETNGDVKRHSVSSDDPLFARLLLWSDDNHNGVSENTELKPASEVLSDIGLGYQRVGREDRFGNMFRFKGWVHIRTGHGRNRVQSGKENNERTRPVYDVYLQVIR